jgi:CubicO group peptidase (beta-lactamase class C family)
MTFLSPPSDVGTDESKLVLLRKIETDIEKEMSDGSAVLVARGGRIVMHEAIGHSDEGNGRKAKIDDVMPIMSLTEQQTASALLVHDQGQVAFC